MDNRTADMDEVTGRGALSFTTRVKCNDNDNPCAQCAEVGLVKSSVAFCKTCTDFLCKDCIDQHRILRATKDHELMDRKVNQDQKPASDEEKCPVHTGRLIEVYCQDDDTFGCLLCFLGNVHTSCTNVALLSDCSRGVESSREFLDVQMAADRFKSLEDQYNRAIEKCRSLNEEWLAVTTEDFQKFRAKILSIVDCIGEKVSEQINKLKEENERKLNTLTENIKSFSVRVQSLMMEIEERQRLKNNKQLFLALKKNGRHVINSVKQMTQLHQDMEINKFEFKSDATIFDHVNTSSSITFEKHNCDNLFCSRVTEVERKKTEQTPFSSATICTSASMVDIKAENDSLDCWVTGILEFSATRLILADWTNLCLKLLDTTTDTIIQRRALESNPMDIAKLPDSRIAVSFPDSQQILIFTTELVPCDTICVDGKCLGLTCTGDELFVAVSSPTAHVLIMDLTGNVLKSIQYDPSGNNLFQFPKYLTGSSPEQDMIFVSDYDQDSVTCMSRDGVMHWIYKNEDLKHPLGVVIGDHGCLYVCSQDTQTIHVVSSDGVSLARIQHNQSGVKSPRALCNCGHNRTLYVPNASNDPKQCNYLTKLNLQSNV